MQEYLEQKAKEEFYLFHDDLDPQDCYWENMTEQQRTIWYRIVSTVH